MIDERALTPTPLPPVRRSRGAWRDVGTSAPFVAAAAILVAVGIGSFLYLARDRSHHAGTADVRPTAGTTILVPKGPVASRTARDANPRSEDVAPPELGPVAAAPDTNPGREMLPQPQSMEPGRVLTAPPAAPVEPFEVVKLPLARLLSFSEVATEAAAEKFRHEVDRDVPVRLELFCSDSARAFEVLTGILRAQKQSLLIDALAQERQKRRMPTQFVFWSESLAADEIARVVQAVQAARKAEPALFDDKFILTPFQATDVADLSQLLGVEPSTLKLVRPRGVGADPRKSLADHTGLQLAQSLGKGGAKGGERSTLVLPFTPARVNPQFSMEVQAYLKNRGERRPNAVPMLLVLRVLNG
jgi:hypothetical protein